MFMITNNSRKFRRAYMPKIVKIRFAIYSEAMNISICKLDKVQPVNISKQNKTYL